ncbi:hypothetical protein BU15DRAFT_65867 [Melanogaster broomeanus]|nr:hypothetical protein BU15DRAFT_65867 [Melanogaster broomeanus]
MQVRPLKLTPVLRDSLPDGWTAQRHPEGALYFMHSESKTFTEVNIRNGDICEDIEYFRDFLFSELQDEIRNRDMSGSLDIDEVQLVMEPKAGHQDLVSNHIIVGGDGILDLINANVVAGSTGTLSQVYVTSLGPEKRDHGHDTPCHMWLVGIHSVLFVQSTRQKGTDVLRWSQVKRKGFSLNPRKFVQSTRQKVTEILRLPQVKQTGFYLNARKFVVRVNHS